MPQRFQNNDRMQTYDHVQSNLRNFARKAAQIKKIEKGLAKNLTRGLKLVKKAETV